MVSVTVVFKRTSGRGSQRKGEGVEVVTTIKGDIQSERRVRQSSYENKKGMDDFFYWAKMVMGWRKRDI